MSAAEASPSPPSSRDEAVSQARSCLATALRKPLNNSAPFRKLKKQRKPQFRVEIPIVDDSLGSFTRLTFDVFSGFDVPRKGGASAKLLLVWPSTEEERVALQELNDWGASTVRAQLDAVVSDALSSCGAAVFLALASRGRSQVEKVRAAADTLDPKPMVLLNPAWSFDEEGLRGLLQRGVLLHGAGGERPPDQEEGRADPVHLGRSIHWEELGPHGRGPGGQRFRRRPGRRGAR
ncbi:hypothetical protein ABZP36_017846 [Zizania latifolia]